MQRYLANIPTTAVKISVLPFKKLSNPYTIGLKSVRSLAGWNPRTYFVSELTLVSFLSVFLGVNSTDFVLPSRSNLTVVLLSLTLSNALSTSSNSDILYLPIWTILSPFFAILLVELDTYLRLVLQ